ncbi:MAG: nucleotidyl transferase AbiEii/AbiGii toxin family protein [Waddliaceae bacterium]
MKGIQIIEERIKAYLPSTKAEELNAFKEIAQEITLSALSRGDLFKQAAFQGGTCLRIIHGVPRFSEDLDFIFFEEDRAFKWEPFFHEIVLEFEVYGFELEVKDRSQAKDAVKKAFLKENSFGKVLKLIYERDRSDTRTIQIKLEVDTHPPIGSTFESRLVDFPFPFSVVVQNLPSLFSGKIHALLCREFIKGRDWFDFVWYVARGVPINYVFLENALVQHGPWKEKPLAIDKDWVKEALDEKVRSIDWKAAKADVENLLRPQELRTLELWNADFFHRYVNKLNSM